MSRGGGRGRPGMAQPPTSLILFPRLEQFFVGRPVCLKVGSGAESPIRLPFHEPLDRPYQTLLGGASIIPYRSSTSYTSYQFACKKYDITTPVSRFLPRAILMPRCAFSIIETEIACVSVPQG